MKTGDFVLFLLYLPTSKAMFVAEEFIQIEPYKNPHRDLPKLYPLSGLLPTVGAAGSLLQLPVPPGIHLLCSPVEFSIHVTSLTI